jgi:hypothetical protein
MNYKHFWSISAFSEPIFSRFALMYCSLVEKLLVIGLLEGEC